MKKFLAGTLAVSTVLGTAVFAESDIKPVTTSEEVTPVLINAEVTTTNANTGTAVARPLIAINPIEIAETNNIVLSYMPKAVNDSMTVTTIPVKSTDLGTPTQSWGLTFVNKEGKEAPIGTIQEYSKASVDISTIDTEMYTVFESDRYVYVAQEDMGRKMYFPESSVDATVLEQYKDNLINFLDPYQIDSTLSVYGINSKFAFKTPEGIMLNTYYTSEYNDGFMDEFTFYYNPMNRKDMPQEIMQIVSTTEELGDEYMLLVDGQYDVYAKVNKESNLTVERDINNYNAMVEILTDEELMKMHTQLPQIQMEKEDYSKELVIDGITIDTEYKFVQEGRVVIPLRDTFEALGYEVVWNQDTQSIDLINGAIFTSVAIGEDNYTFGRKAGVKLGLAPMLIDGTTYVPLEFVSKVLPYDVTKLENGLISIGTK